MTKHLPILIIALAIALITGCASTTPPTGCSPDKTWDRPNTTPEEMQQDLAVCQYDALLNRRSTSVYGDTAGQTLLLKAVADSSEENKENQMVNVCMKAKGYTLVKTISLQPGVSEVDNQTQNATVSPDIEETLLGSWKTTSFRTELNPSDQDQIEKLRFSFFPKQRLLLEKIYKNGIAEPELDHYKIIGNSIETINPFLAEKDKKTTTSFSLVGNQMILTTDNIQIILNKVLETNSVPEIDTLLLGNWFWRLQNNQTEAQIHLTLKPINRYTMQTTATSPQKSLNEIEDGIWCYDAEHPTVVMWSDKDAEPEMDKCHFADKTLTIVTKRGALTFTKAGN
jgi:hypothetical protein